MKRVIPALVLIVILASCQYHVDDPPPPGPVTEKHVIRDVDYVRDKYFLFDDPKHFIGAQNNFLNVYRTVLPRDIVVDPEILRFPGWVMPDSMGDGQAIHDVAAVINAGHRPSAALVQDFQFLEPGKDFELIVDPVSRVIIGIELTLPLPATATKAIGVSYLNMDGIVVGGSYASLGVNDHDTGVPPTPGSAGDSLMLEMLKAPDPRPSGPFGSTWKLELRNVYDLGWTDIQPGSLKVVIKDQLWSRDDESRPLGSSIPYLRIFGLDYVGKNGTGPHDGAIDPWFVDFARGILWMPVVNAFAPDPGDVSRWTDDEFAFTGPYLAQYNVSKQIYERLLNPTQTEEVHQYDIHVTRTMPAP